MRRGHLASLLAGLMVLGWLVSGCYTVIKHPVLRASYEEGSEVRVTYGDDCWSCHSSRSESFWVEEVPPAAAGYYAWEYFYGSPWWLDAYYFDQGSAATGESAGLRTFPRRGQSEVTPGAPAVQQPSPTLRAVARKASSGSEAAGLSPVVPDDDRRPVARRGSGPGRDTSKSKRRQRKE